MFIYFICLFFLLPELLETFCLAKQEAAEGKEESIIFRYCSRARFRMSFSSLAGTSFEPDVSSCFPGQNKLYSRCQIFLLLHCCSKESNGFFLAFHIVSKTLFSL